MFLFCFMQYSEVLRRGRRNSEKSVKLKLGAWEQEQRCGPLNGLHLVFFHSLTSRWTSRHIIYGFNICCVSAKFMQFREFYIFLSAHPTPPQLCCIYQICVSRGYNYHFVGHLPFFLGHFLELCSPLHPLLLVIYEI